ncbi:MAG: WYL domain-containing protein [Melioribacteraceae bacterium]|nr:WYL domain-containing protein [Melioribacteraceae bacterium]
MLNQRIARLLGIILLLRAKEWVSAKELAERFNVTLRTIYRDIAAIQDNNIPIEGISGPDGGYRLKLEGSIDPSLFTNDEAFSLYLIGSGTPSSNDLYNRKIESILNSLEGKINKDELKILKLAKSRIIFDTEEWYWKNEESNMIPKIREALLNQIRISIEIKINSKKKIEKKIVLPYGLVWKGGQWYLVGPEKKSSLIKRYRVSRIVSVQIFDENFDYPTTFDLQTWWENELENYGKGNIEVVLFVKSDAVEEFKLLTLKNNSKIVNVGDDIRITLYIDKWNWLIPLLLSYSGSVFVEKPSELRDEIINLMKNTITNYEQNYITGSQSYLLDDSRKRALHAKENNPE